MKKRTRVAALLLCALLCFAMTVSVAFIAAESGHACEGEHCHVCVELRACLSFIKSLSFIAAVVAALLSARYVIDPIIRRAVLDSAGPTLVSLKVKLSN
ncbi:MAG: hypothetical protein LBS36_00360 [Oscillospiraceae bacterium]|jgi:hypothetical protein|nr:hypothetical protein [Oscillospiraceae bacterium]